jgi:hypothetical protein
LLDKAKFLIVSEITNANPVDETKISSKIDGLVAAACEKHLAVQPLVMTATVH